MEFFNPSSQLSGCVSCNSSNIQSKKQKEYNLTSDCDSSCHTTNYSQNLLPSLDIDPILAMKIRLMGDKIMEFNLNEVRRKNGWAFPEGYCYTINSEKDFINFITDTNVENFAAVQFRIWLNSHPCVSVLPVFLYLNMCLCYCPDWINNECGDKHHMPNHFVNFVADSSNTAYAGGWNPDFCASSYGSSQKFNPTNVSAPAAILYPPSVITWDDVLNVYNKTIDNLPKDENVNPSYEQIVQNTRKDSRENPPNNRPETIPIGGTLFWDQAFVVPYEDICIWQCQKEGGTEAECIDACQGSYGIVTDLSILTGLSYNASPWIWDDSSGACVQSPNGTAGTYATQKQCDKVHRIGPTQYYKFDADTDLCLPSGDPDADQTLAGCCAANPSAYNCAANLPVGAVGLILGLAAVFFIFLVIYDAKAFFGGE